MELMFLWGRGGGGENKEINKIEACGMGVSSPSHGVLSTEVVA